MQEKPSNKKRSAYSETARLSLKVEQLETEIKTLRHTIKILLEIQSAKDEEYARQREARRRMDRDLYGAEDVAPGS